MKPRLRVAMPTKQMTWHSHKSSKHVSPHHKGKAIKSENLTLAELIKLGRLDESINLQLKQLPNKNITKDEQNSIQKTVNQMKKVNYNVSSTEYKEQLLTSQPKHSNKYPSQSQSHSQKYQKPNLRQNQSQHQTHSQSQHRQNAQFETKYNQRQNEDICTRCGL